MPEKYIVINVDFFDEVCIREKPFNAADVDELARRCAEAGIDALYWRAIGLGVAGYPSRLLQPPQTLIDADMSLLLPRMSEEDRGEELPSVVQDDENFVLDVQQARGYRQRIGGWGKRIAASLDEMDPLAQARDACRKYGLEFHIWHDFLDERHNLSLTRHPEWLVTGKDGVTRFPGLRSYAVKEAVEDQLLVIKELLAYEPDGLYFSTSCHNRHLNFPEAGDYFGFEEPIVEACRNEMSVDIRTEPFDVQRWHEVKGRAYTDFFRQVAQLAHAQEAAIAIGTQLGINTILTAPVFSTHVSYRFATGWRQWVDENIADTLILGDYEWPWDNVPIWQAKQMQWPPGTYAADHEWKTYADYAGGRARLYWFSSWMSAYAAKHEGASADSLAGAMQLRSNTLRATEVQGICLHEAMTYEQEADGFDTVTAMRRALEGGPELF